MKRISRFSFVLFLFVGVGFGLALNGCDQPEHSAAYYGTVLKELPDLPEAKEPFDIPEVEGVDKEEIMSKRFLR